MHINKLKYRGLLQLSMEERGEIMGKLRRREMTCAAIADVHKTKLGVIRRMSKDVKRGEPVYQKKIEKHQNGLAKLALVQDVIKTHLEEGGYIFHLE